MYIHNIYLPFTRRIHLLFKHQIFEELDFQGLHFLVSFKGGYTPPKSSRTGRDPRISLILETRNSKFQVPFVLSVAWAQDMCFIIS